MEAQIDEFRQSPCHEKLRKICDRFDRDDDPDSKNVMLKDEIIEICMGGHWAEEQDLHCKQVGGNPDNRGGEGVLWRRAHTRISVLKKSGCSLATLQAGSVAAEDNPFTRKFAKYTAALQHRSPCFARYEESVVKVGALGGTHCFHGFSCAFDGVPCDDPEISTNGLMDKYKIYKGDPGLRQAIDGKLRVKVIRWQVLAALPKIGDIIIGALNTVHQSSEGETWVQNLLQIHAECSKYPEGKLKLDQVKKAVLRSQPPRAEDVPIMADYVQRWGGLPSGAFLKELATLLAAFMPSTRVVNGNFFEEVVKMKFPVDQQPAEVVNALLFTHACTDKEVRDNIAHFITRADINTIASEANRKTVMLANGILSHSRIDLQTPEQKT